MNRHNPSKIRSNIFLGGDLFENIVLLLLSVLHGSLYLELCSNTLNLIKKHDIMSISIIVLQYAVYFRVFQSYILAAIDYKDKWDIKPFDYLIIFLTILPEYFFLKVFEITSYIIPFTCIVLVVFSIAGVATYINAYRKVKGRIRNRIKRRKERKIQMINATSLCVVSTLYITVLIIYYSDYHALPYFTGCNFVTSGILLSNIFTSINLSFNYS